MNDAHAHTSAASTDDRGEAHGSAVRDDALLTIEVVDPDADEETLYRAVRTLREELTELDVTSVSFATSGPAPSGSKGLDVDSVGALVVMLKDSAFLTTQVIAAVRAWMGRRSAPGEAHTMRVTLNGQTLELTSASSEEQQRLVDAFIRSAVQPG